jgi:hypothetical protein
MTIVTPVIVGCVDYLFMTADSEHHYSGFSMLFGMGLPQGLPKTTSPGQIQIADMDGYTGMLIDLPLIAKLRFPGGWTAN